MKVSVLMTAFNREKYIQEAIESVLQQTYTNFELIIVDDGSVDKTVSIVNRFLLKDRRIQFHKNASNLGDYPNRNKAASYATGDILMYVDSDDTIKPDTLMYITTIFDQNPGVDFAMIYYGNKLKDMHVFDPQMAINTHFFDHPFLTVGPGGTVITKKHFEKIGGFSKYYGPATDMYYNLHAASSAKMICHQYPYLNYRIHEGQEKNNHFAYLYQGFLYLRDALKELPLMLEEAQIEYLNKKNKRRFFINMIKYAIKSWNLKQVKKAIVITNFKLSDMWVSIFQ